MSGAVHVQQASEPHNPLQNPGCHPLLIWPCGTQAHDTPSPLTPRGPTLQYLGHGWYDESDLLSVVGWVDADVALQDGLLHVLQPAAVKRRHQQRTGIWN